jgi:hypothetical protein
MISFGVIVRDVLANSCSKRIFAKEDHSFQAVFLDRPDKPFRICHSTTGAVGARQPKVRFLKRRSI